MKKLVMFAHSYWELHWTYRVLKSLSIPVVSDSPHVYEVAKKLGLVTIETDWRQWLGENDFDGVITTNMHLGQNRETVEKFFGSGRLAILMQHAWDSDLNILDKFWNYDMSRFTHYLVGSTQDEEWLRAKHGDKIVYTGMPRLDDLYEVKQEAMDNQGQFFLSIIPDNGVHGDRVRQEYFHLASSGKYNVRFKIHPGGQYEPTKQSLLDVNPNFICLPDPDDDPLYTYRMIQSSSGVLAVESFITVETSLLEKPIIFFGIDQMDSSFYNREENSRQKDRLDPNMSSTIDSPIFTDAQRKISERYLCDGQNTKRVVEYLYKLINE
ncbi:MAG: hypothetical protein KCHDKBKB_00763 [Elusimicrobia bacterium]|nr:hypothetical protein [Elusimicrobiota bacterium]